MRVFLLYHKILIFLQLYFFDTEGPVEVRNSDSIVTIIIQPRQIRPSEAFETCIPFADTFLPPDKVQNFMERTRPECYLRSVS